VSTNRDHLDAETVAAWMDGGLDAASLAAAEAHASNCERCQELLATVAKTMPGRDVAPGFSRGIPRLKAGATSLWWRWWMAPIAAAAAAVTLWMVVPQEQLRQAQRIEPAPTVAARDQSAPMAQPAQPPAASKPLPDQRFDEAKRQAAAPRTPQAAQEKLGAAAANVAESAGARAREAKEERPVARLEAAPARAPAAPPPAAPAEAPAMRDNAPMTQLRKQAAPLTFVSPDPRFRWRAGADGIERSEDSGRTWFIVRLPQGEVITAGSSPSPLVCWLVGRAGVVLVATDGTNFTPILFPAKVDLASVTSPELRIATITAVDGRIFHTENAGRTWRQQ
jgi:hypothetical protein